MLIGLCGYAGAGKDTVARHLVNRSGFTARSISYPIKVMLNTRFGWSHHMWEDRAWKDRPCQQYGAYDTHNWGELPCFSPRSWAQWLGTEVGRVLGGEDVWINMLLSEYNASPRDSHWIVSDVRFPNEAQLIRQAGGEVFMISRGGLLPDNHASERAVDKVVADKWFANEEGNPGAMLGAVDQYIEDYL